MRYALVFSGQGHQHPAMMPWLAADPLVEAVEQRLGVRDWRRALDDASWATTNRHAQVLLTGLALAAWRQLRAALPAPTGQAALPAPAGLAGYSVGELAAFSVAGLFDESTALALADARARRMDDCAALAPGSLLGVTGLLADEIASVCAASGSVVAIRNGIDSVVLGGDPAAIDRAALRVAAAGGRVTRLAVGLASHTPLLRPAVTDFEQVLRATPMRPPRLPLFGHDGDRVWSAAAAATGLATQLAATVRWDLAMDSLAARAPLRVLEIGPGQALARLWRQRHPAIEARSCDDFRSARAVVAWLASD